MHVIHDENGQVSPHSHEHHHGHHEGEHCHEHTHDCKECAGGDCKKETVALLTYMLQHNQHHAAELAQMAENLKKLGIEDAAKQIEEGVADFEKGNLRLSVALSLVKEKEA